MPRRSKLNPLVLATSVFLLRAASVWAGEAATTGLTVGEFARMEKGEVVVKTHTYATGDDKRAARAVAYCLINKPPDAVWEVLLSMRRRTESDGTWKREPLDAWDDLRPRERAGVAAP